MNGVYSENSIEKLFTDSEYQLYYDLNKYQDENLGCDIKKDYLKEVNKYPLLTKEEEIQYGRMLKYPEKKKMLVIKDNNNYIVTDLNIPVLFYSLCNNSSYQMIINSIIKFYSRLISNNDKTIMILKRYLKEANFVNRALNKEEIFNIFHIVDVNNRLDEKELLSEIKEFMNYKYAFDKMFVSNLRLVLSVASKYYARCDYMDLVNEGNIGLLKAIQRFDIDKENKFSTYAMYWIKMSIKRAIYNSSSIVKIPERTLFEVYSFKRQINLLEQKLGRSISYDEISEMLNIPMDDIQRYYMLLKDELYLDSTIDDESDMEVKDIIPSDVSVEDDCLDAALQKDIEKLFIALDEREINVIKMYYGLGEYREANKNICDIAQIMHVSPQRINQIKMRAIFKMRRLAKRNKELSEMRLYVK